MKTPPTPPPPSTPEDPFTLLERELRLLLRRGSAQANAMAKRVHPDLDASAYPLLAHVATHQGARGSDLAEQFGIGRATVSRQLSRLDDLGLVQREVDPEDSRGQLISLTDEGLARLKAAQQARISIITNALNEWETADVAALGTLLHRYSEDVVRWRSEQ